MDDMQAMAPGTVVYGADGESVGTVESSDASTIVVDTGAFPAELYIPVSAIAETREDGAYLTVASGDVLSQGWGEAPPDPEIPEEAGESGYSAIQGEDSMDERFDPMPVEE